MKKLALASAAFAAVSAFGAGDAFATPAVTIADNGVGFTSNDSATWPAPVSGGTVATTVASSTGNYTATTSVQSVLGINVGAAYTTHLSAGGSVSLFYGVQGGGTFGQDVHFGFPTNSAILWGTTSQGAGTLALNFSGGIKGIDFLASPGGFAQSSSLGNAFSVSVDVFGKTTGGYSGSLGDQTFAGTIMNGCAGPSCTLISATAGKDTLITGISVMFSTTGTDKTVLPPAISVLSMEDAPAMPEPASLSVLTIGLLGLGALRRRQRAHAPCDGSHWSPFGRWRMADDPPDATTD